MSIFNIIFGSGKTSFIEKKASSVTEKLCANVDSKEMAVALTYSLVCQATVGITPDKTPEYIKRFALKCSDGLTELEDGHEEALNRNLSRESMFNGKFDDDISEPISLFINEKNAISNEEKRQEFSYLTVKKVMGRLELL